MKNFVIGIALLLVCNFCFGYSQDVGVVSKVYVNTSGNIAFQITGGFDNANADEQCPNNNGWAGVISPVPVMVSTILAAKAAGFEIKATTLGCHGSWIKVIDIYIN